MNGEEAPTAPENEHRLSVVASPSKGDVLIYEIRQAVAMTTCLIKSFSVS